MLPKKLENSSKDSVQKVHAGSELVTKSGQTLQEIVESVKEATGLTVEIAEASTTQAVGANQITQAVAEIDDMTLQNSIVSWESHETCGHIGRPCFWPPGIVRSV